MNAEPAIRIEGLGKKYRIQHQAAGSGSINRFSEQIIEWAAAPFRRLKRLAGGGRHHALPDAEALGVRGGTEDFWALDGIGFEVQPGEVVGIVGRNGAGKSTLLKVLSRITEPTRGRVELNGRVASLLEVGTGFHPELTGRENIYLNGSILGMSRAEISAKFDEIVAFAEIERFLDTPVKRYSSGMYVRLAFAVAAHLEPEILIVDEVLAVGDAKFQSKCLGKMSDVAKGGRTVLFVSHNMAAVEALCDRGVLIEAGRIACVGPIQEVLSAYSAADGEAVGLVDLGAHEGRAPGYSAQLKGLHFFDPESGDTLPGSVALGGDVVMDLSGTSALPVSRGKIVIRIDKPSGTRVTTLISSYQHAEAFAFDGAFRIRCRLDNCRLLPGAYQMRILLQNGDEILDDLSGIPFTVTDADIYGTGRSLPERTGFYAPEVTWQSIPNS